MKRFVVERFEGVFAVCMSGEKASVNIPKYKLPREVKPGDKIYQDDENMFYIDKEVPMDKEKKPRSKADR